jgi:hypothetical protein
VLAGVRVAFTRAAKRRKASESGGLVKIEEITERQEARGAPKPVWLMDVPNAFLLCFGVMCWWMKLGSDNA